MLMSLFHNGKDLIQYATVFELLNSAFECVLQL